MRSFYLFLIICLVLLCGCHGTKTITERVEVPVVVTQEHTIESVRIDHIRDTLVQRDSIYHFVQGDTVRIERWHHVANVSKMIVADTIRDTIPRIVTVKETVVQEVNRLHWWQKVLMTAGIIGIIAMLLYAGAKSLRK